MKARGGGLDLIVIPVHVLKTDSRSPARVVLLQQNYPVLLTFVNYRISGFVARVVIGGGVPISRVSGAALNNSRE